MDDKNAPKVRRPAQILGHRPFGVPPSLHFQSNLPAALDHQFCFLYEVLLRRMVGATTTALVFPASRGNSETTQSLSVLVASSFYHNLQQLFPEASTFKPLLLHFLRNHNLWSLLFVLGVAKAAKRGIVASELAGRDADRLLVGRMWGLASIAVWVQ